MTDLCEQKNSSEKPCPNSASAGVENPKLEVKRKRSGPHLRDGKKWTVYCLASSGRIKYIGITSHTIKARLNGHIHSSKRKKLKCYLWMTNEIAAGKKMRIRALKTGLSVNEACDMETKLIKQYSDRLVNVRSSALPFGGSELLKAKWKQSRWGHKSLSRRDRHLIKLENMRQRKEEIRQERIAAGLLEREPRMKRWYRFQFGVRDKQTGEMHFTDLRSVRQAAKALGLILKFL